MTEHFNIREFVIWGLAILAFVLYLTKPQQITKTDTVYADKPVNACWGYEEHGQDYDLKSLCFATHNCVEQGGKLKWFYMDTKDGYGQRTPKFECQY